MFIAPTAVVLGPVALAARSSVWFHAVLRADGDAITVGAESNIQDGAVLHTDPGYPIRLGARVSVGHHATLHGCEVGDDVLIGMGATVLDGSRIGSRCVVAAGTVVQENRRIPPGSLVAGSEAPVVRPLDDQHLDLIKTATQWYLALPRLHSPPGAGPHP
ncbi:gamma carbonic anhydrase family protein [Streptomyces stramineus]|uniref:gamma carbonic anhydrase family protein n=1 Tax=Streptomyces TaxID=1883 RepID=UPI0031CE3F8A